MREAAGIVLAGVHRWGDSEFDELLPWPLMPVVHRPLICHVLAWLRAGGVGHAVICANSASRQVRHVVADGAGLGIDIEHFEDWTPRGPAGCIRDAALQTDAELFVVSEGTILPECDLVEVLERHSRSDAAMTIVVTRDPDGSNGAVKRLVPAGIYVLDRSVLDYVPETGYQDIKEVLLPRLHKRGVRIRSHTLATLSPRMTDAGSYVAMNARALERLAQTELVPPGYRRIGGVIVHESVHLPPLDGLVGPLLIGPGTTIGAGATLVGPTTIGCDCVIEPLAVVCHSVLWDGCRVRRGAAVNHCVLADAVELEAEAVWLHAVSAGGPSHHRFRSTSHLESLLFPVCAEPGYEHLPAEDEPRAAANPGVRSAASAPSGVASG